MEHPGGPAVSAEPSVGPRGVFPRSVLRSKLLPEFTLRPHYQVFTVLTLATIVQKPTISKTAGNMYQGSERDYTHGHCLTIVFLTAKHAKLVFCLFVLSYLFFF